MAIFDAFPFFNELDVLEIRLAELAPIVDKFVIVECKETYGGDLKPLYLQSNWSRFKPWHDKIVPVVIDRLLPPLSHRLQENVAGISAADIRNAGRARERYARDVMGQYLWELNPKPSDILSFGDCDEIPRASAVLEIARILTSRTPARIHRLKQRTYYYNINTQIDYGRDVCSRARVGTFWNLASECAGSLYNFRMAGNKDAGFPAIEEAGWHFSYFGGDLNKLHEKVDALNPFLQEYKLFGDGNLVQDILQRKDLHRRPLGFSELPEQFEYRASTDPLLPKHLLANPDRFAHFTQEHFARKYGKA